MKRLAIFCDGTWNQLASPHNTNVVLGAQAVLPRSKDGINQASYYNEGVGTSYLVSRRLSRWIAGGLGLGLFDKIAEAYRFLVLNYELGDEIYVFGFSRGAYTARSLAGMITHCGILRREHIENVPRAFNFYKTRTSDMRSDSVNAKKFRAVHSYRTLMDEEERNWRREHYPQSDLESLPLFEITYLGVWDTVGALGMPKHLGFSTNKYQFHDASLSGRVASARHAVAIDEMRKSFEPALWDNLEELRNTRGNRDDYEQLWFPGDHGSVGGGGDITGLSDSALLWILEGAERKGLELDRGLLGAWRQRTQSMAPLHNSSEGHGFMHRLYSKAPRKGPASLNELSESARERLMNESKSADAKLYRPVALKHLWPQP
jgi:uncharacterized protein (DUF2235 family)